MKETPEDAHMAIDPLLRTSGNCHIERGGGGSIILKPTQT